VLRLTTHKHEMTTCHPKRKARRKNWKAWDRCTSLLAHEAKRAKIIASAVAATEVGKVVFSGTVFGGVVHRMRLLNRDGEKHLLVEFDGVPAKPQTYRGMLRMIARRIAK